MNRKYPHFAIPEIYGESLSYYELLRKLVETMNVVIENYDTIPDQIAEAVANLDASQLFSAVLAQLIDSIATDNTKSTNAVKVYKKHDLLYATFNYTVNLYEAIIDFSEGSTTELIIGTNIREVNISELFIELRKLISDEALTREQSDTALQTNIRNEAQAREHADNALQTNIDNEAHARQQADTDLQTNIDNEARAREQADTALQTSIANGTLKMDLLWNNNEPTNAFESRSINVNYSNYKILLFTFKESTSRNKVSTILIPATEKEATVTLYNSQTAKINARSFTLENNLISFTNGIDMTSIGNADLVSTLVIPFQIFGIK